MLERPQGLLGPARLVQPRVNKTQLIVCAGKIGPLAGDGLEKG